MPPRLTALEHRHNWPLVAGSGQSARISTLAESSQVLVSSTVKDLVAGSGLEFEDRGAHTLKGVPDEGRLYAVINA